MDINEADLKGKIDQTCTIAEQFAKVYYDTIDRRRNVSDLISTMYMDTATLIWNGNGISGKKNIQTYLANLPSTNHTITTLDAQPILNSALGSQLTFIIQVSGSVQYDDNPTKTFHQNFVVTAGYKWWKIMSDSFRLQDYAKCNIN